MIWVGFAGLHLDLFGVEYLLSFLFVSIVSECIVSVRLREQAYKEVF